LRSITWNLHATTSGIAIGTPTYPAPLDNLDFLASLTSAYSLSIYTTNVTRNLATALCGTGMSVMHVLAIYAIMIDYNIANKTVTSASFNHFQFPGEFLNLPESE
jgi:hypothetical protein